MTWFIPPYLLLACIGAMALLKAHLPLAPLLPEPAGLLGGGSLVAAGLALVVAVRLKFRRRSTDIHTFRPPTVLVQDGLFALSRNPLYLGFVVILLGVALMLDAASTLAIVALFILVTDRWYIRHEEMAALRAFGPEYEAYRRRTRKWV